MRLARVLDEQGTLHVADWHDELVSIVTVKSGNGNAELLELAMSRGSTPAGATTLDPERVTVLAPLAQPPSVRDFLTFERHFEVMLRKEDGTLPEAWYDAPAFYFTSPHDILGPGEAVEPPPGCQELDYECEVAVVIGREGRNVSAADAPDLIAGYTMFNDFSARDIQRREMTVGLGPSKCKDFGGALGPVLVTPDEMPGEPGRPTGGLRAKVNDVAYSADDLGHMKFSFAEMIAHASSGGYVRVGDVLGSGTCATGCIAELSKTFGSERYPWLNPGDVVELSHETIGSLVNTVAGGTGV